MADSGMTYLTSGGSQVSLPARIDIEEKIGKRKFYQLIMAPSRQSRAELSLKYDCVDRENLDMRSTRYTSLDGRYYDYDVSSPFTLAAMGNTRMLIKTMHSMPGLLNEKDEFNETMFYKAVRAGFCDMVEFLLGRGVAIDEVNNKSGSTALHAASFYGHEIVVALLLAKGADCTIRNNYGNTAEDEARSPEIRRLFQMDAVEQPLQDLVSCQVAVCLRPLRHADSVIGWKVDRHPQLIMNEIGAPHVPHDWNVAWHGTKRRHLKSILQHGLQPSGSSLPDGSKIVPPLGHFGLDKQFFGISNFAAAIFVSPSVAYAGHPCYAERIPALGDTWVVLVQVCVRPGSFNRFRSTISGYVPLDGFSDNNPEHRVGAVLPGHPMFAHPSVEDAEADAGDDVNTIHRIEDGGGFVNAAVVAVLFVARSFLEQSGLSNSEAVGLLADT